MARIQRGAAASQRVADANPAVEARRIAVETAQELAADDPQEAWHWPWILARRLRTVAGIERKIDPMSLRGALVAAHSALGQVVEETDFAEVGCLVAAVVAVWSKVVFADGEGPLETAVRRAAARPLFPEPSLGTTYARLVSVAYYLQELQGAEPILLPVHRFDAVLAVSAMQVSRLLGAATRLGHLEMIDPSYWPGHARRWRCHVQAPADERGRLYRLGPRR